MSEKNELMMALEQIEKDKGIPKEEILLVIENALVSAYKKHVGKIVAVEAKVDQQTGAMNAWAVKKVVPDVRNPSLEVDLAEARRFDSAAIMDAEVRIPLDTQDFSRIAAQTAKQVIVQKIRESERATLLDELQGKVGQMVSGSVWRFMSRNIIVDLIKTEAVLPVAEQVPRERFALGQHIRALVLRVERGMRGPQVVLTRTHADLVRRLFEVEVPEIYEKIVEIINVVREPGMRTKLAVISHNPKVDPVGACVGVKGARVRPIIDELQGERIDLVPFNSDPVKFISSALSPAKPLSVTLLSTEEKQAEVLIADDMLALAIGKNGHNVRLAARLTGWHIDVRSESQKKAASQQKQEATAASLEKLEGVGPKTAEILVTAGIADIGRLASATVEELTTLQGIGAKTAEKVIEAARRYVESPEADEQKTAVAPDQTGETPEIKE